MSCRQWLSSVMRQCQSGLVQQQQQQQPRAFSTSAPVAAFRRILGETPTDPNSNKTPVRRSRANPNEALHGLVSDGMGRGGPLSAEEQRQVMRQQGPRAHVKELRSSEITESYVRQMPRRWKTGDVYAPRDLSPAEMIKWRKGRAPNKDVVDMLGFNPLDNYRNFSLISEFITPMGRIKHSSDTGLRPVNQRKMAKAIRRAVAMGLHPSVHKHPEILRLSRHGAPTQAVPERPDPSQNFL